ncbi:Dystroglycan 1 (dystrophin-associated glycoprotein 1) [Desmophyllum pertusum]|uniref:Dystroglycan 1 (Dystrophin-associated glycoprotein 1) n=1 Tax=Desmophyllum pertusum TaxID=174260 RepID=A0A9X0CLF6_9CNID|nr:Dystroglycan 1 (dystrophin-associated glycoprotein 1) [Desmophyllum pertusum]
MKCKPWRRKSTPKWTWLDTFSWLKLSLLLASFFHVVLQVLSRTIFTKTTSRFRLHWILLIISFLGGIFLPLASCQDSLQPTPSVKGQLPNAVVYVGSAFSYNISESVFDCDVDSIMVSETADRFLSHWLSYNSNKKQLYGVPSDKDKGTYNILVVALTKDAMVRGHVCGSRSFSIVVMPVSEELPVSVHLGTGISSSSYHKSAHSLSCFPGTQAVLGTIILNADIQGLNGHERMTLLLKMANHLNIHSSKVSFFSGEISHPIIQHLDNPAVIAAGVGDGRFAKGSRSLLTWNIGCGAVKLEDVAFSRLETDAQDGTITTLLGFPVVGWHVMSGAQKNMARRRVRRQAVWAGNTPTPTMSSAPPTRVSSMSTLVITSRSVTLTSAFSDSSTIRLSTSAASSVTPTEQLSNLLASA